MYSYELLCVSVCFSLWGIMALLLYVVPRIDTVFLTHTIAIKWISFSSYHSVCIFHFLRFCVWDGEENDTLCSIRFIRLSLWLYLLCKAPMPTRVQDNIKQNSVSLHLQKKESIHFYHVFFMTAHVVSVIRLNILVCTANNISDKTSQSLLQGLFFNIFPILTVRNFFWPAQYLIVYVFISQIYLSFSLSEVDRCTTNKNYCWKKIYVCLRCCNLNTLQS